MVIYEDAGIAFFSGLGWRPFRKEWREGFVVDIGWGEYVLLDHAADQIWIEKLMSTQPAAEVNGICTDYLPAKLTIGSHIVPIGDSALSNLSCNCHFGFSGGHTQNHTQSVIVLSTGVTAGSSQDVPVIPLPAGGVLLMSAIAALAMLRAVKAKTRG